MVFSPPSGEGLGEGAKLDAHKPSPQPSPKGRGRKFVGHRPLDKLNFVGHYSNMYEFAVTPAVTSIRRRGVEIAEVSAESLGFELELESGDRIIKVNGRPVRDYLDFRFQTA